MEYKNVSGSLSDVDSTSRRVKIVISEMGSKDHDNDVIDRTAFNKTIAERGPKAGNKIYFLRDHNTTIGNGLIGKFDDLYTAGNQLIGIATLPKTTIGNDMMEHYQAGNIQQHSIGFQSVSAQAVKDGKNGFRLIKEVKLFEGSAVLFASNENTPTLSVGKSLNPEALCGQLDFMFKEIKSGRYSEDGYELLGLWFAQLTDRVKSLGDTTPAASAPGPDLSEYITESFTRLNDLFTVGRTYKGRDLRERLQN